MSQIGRGSLNFKLAIGEMNFRSHGFFDHEQRSGPRNIKVVLSLSLILIKNPKWHDYDDDKEMP